MLRGRLARSYLGRRCLATNAGDNGSSAFSRLESQSQREQAGPRQEDSRSTHRTRPGFGNDRPNFGVKSRGSSFSGGKSWHRGERNGVEKSGRHPSSRPRPRQNGPPRDVPFDRNDTPYRSSRGGSLPHSQREEEKRTHDADNIPFENSSAQKQVLSMEASSITPRERGIFAKLFRMQPAQFTPTNAEIDLDSSRKSASPASNGAQSDVKQRREEAEAEGVNQDALVETELKRVVNMFQDAKTDTELCRILTRDVLGPAINLNLDSIASDTRTAVLTSLEGIKNEDETTQCDLEIFSRAFPQHLLNFMDVISKKFPSSTMWNVLPMVQRLGPATFALGGSTALYNAHMLMVWQRYQDCRRIINLLEDMDRNVYLYDGGTQRLVAYILKELSHQRGGNYGDAVRELCRPSVEEVDALTAMKSRIMQQRQDEALRVARAMTAKSDAGWEDTVPARL